MIIGDGPQRRELEALACRSGLSDSIRFTGSLSPAEVARWMRRSELFVLPSREEGQGVAMLEALASGTPCVASKVGGIPEVLSPQWGVLVPPEDSQALAAAMEGILDRGDRGRSMGQAAASAVRERYDWAAIARRVRGVYEEVLSAPVSKVGISNQV